MQTINLKSDFLGSLLIINAERRLDLNKKKKSQNMPENTTEEAPEIWNEEFSEQVNP